MIPEYVYKPFEERTLDELKETLKGLERAIKYHSNLAYWGNVESKMKLRELRYNKKKVQELIKQK